MKKGLLSIVLALFWLTSVSMAKDFMTHPTEGFVGPDTCKLCHTDIHKQWSSSWHTKKTEWGPAYPEQYLKGRDYPWGSEKIYPWVKRDWDTLDTYMILDRKDATTNYVAIDKIKFEEVELVVGSQRKQRYAVYYDGSPRKAWLATTETGGISWKLDKSTVVDYPGNKERAGYKFLFIEVNPTDGKMNKNNYGEFYSWQERCIACHSTGFDADAWYKAKDEFVAGKRDHLRDTFVSSIEVSCEACHGGGAAHAKMPSKTNIINPAKLTDPTERQVVCSRCHTRTAMNTKYGKGSNDNRGFIVGQSKYEDVMQYTRPNWGKGNRQVSIDGKGRRDHQQDMDIKLGYTIKGENSVHAKMACFDCHTSHNVGNNPKSPWLFDKTAVETCAKCHGDKAESLVKVLSGADGWPKYGYGNWNNEGGRSKNKQHIFNVDSEGRSFGLTPEQYHWALKKDGDAKKAEDWQSIWPWEKEQMEKAGRKVFVGADPLK
ncbi:multiheme c-type cytochrome [Chrysiogenes arsenatis]|uniref:multiheme c-type cytochrome n=1 Tax=Chrysiogenes arsenatis TaxID=309797 RepID=UPI0003FA29CF|nr:multiheme c-type cytochrome [Chrysiogenes arsenatis]